MLKTFNDINQIGLVKGELYISRINSGLYKYAEDSLIKISDQKIHFFFDFNNDFLFFQDHISQVLRLNDKLEVSIVVNGQFSFVTLKLYPDCFFVRGKMNGERITRRVNAFYQVDEIRYNDVISRYYKNYGFSMTGEKIEAFLINENTPAWEFEAGQFGSISEWSSEQQKEIKVPNSINSRNVIFFKQKIILTLQGGQLCALDIESGKIDWFFDVPHKNIFDLEKDGIIYGMDNANSILYALDAESGAVRTKKDVNEEIKKRGLPYLDGHLLVFENKLFVRFAKDGYIGLFDIHSLELTEIRQIPGAFLGLWQDNVIWYKDKLFVLDPVSHVLYTDI
jgi:outer membrane protein assembly factor BamB